MNRIELRNKEVVAFLTKNSDEKNIQKLSRYFKEGLASMIGENRKGGNKRYLSENESAKLLKTFEKQSDSGHMLVISDIKKAYEKKIGKEVLCSTIYRMVARQKWRKIMPRSKHPKSKPEEQEAYKKNH